MSPLPSSTRSPTPRLARWFLVGAFCWTIAHPPSAIAHPGAEEGHICDDGSAACEADLYAGGPSPDIFETYPDGTLPEVEAVMGTMGTSGPIAPAAGQPQGALSGRIVYMSAGHGWTQGTSGWFLQRGITHEMNEDYGTLDQMNFFAQYIFNAGGTVVPFRPIGNQTNEVIVDNVSPGVVWSGNWNNSSQTTFYGNPGEVPYRWTSLATSETATATYVPNIPEAGHYPVYTWVLHGNDRTFQLYRIRHTGGESEVRVPHHMVGNGWVYLGTYYFNAGSNPNQGAVVISNLQASPAVGTVAIADAIRFGNGMSNHGSTYPKEEEASRYWVENSLGVGQPTSILGSTTNHQSGNTGTPPRMAREMNREQNGSFFNRIYLGFHTNASNGAARGTIGLHNDNWPGTSTPNQRRWAQIIATEVSDQMVALSPLLESPWHARSAAGLIWSHTDYPFGEIHNTSIGGEMDATIIEVAFHDNLTDARLLRDPKVRNWSSRASYRAVVKYMNEFGSGPLVFLPEPPRNPRVVANQAGGAVVSWDVPLISAGSGAPAEYVVYRSSDGHGFGNPVMVSGPNTTSVTIPNLPADTNHYFRVAARNAGGESFPTPTVGVRRSVDPAAPRVLIVNGFDKFDRFINIRQTPTAGNYRAPGHNGNTGTMDRVLPRRTNSFEYIVPHGQAVGAAGMAFDSCEKDAVANNQISLAKYSIVIWAAGQQTTDGRTFTTAAQNRLTTFLQNKGALLVSGSEIAFDLDRPTGPTAADRAFLHQQLRVRFSAANSQSYTVSPVAGTVFAGRSNATFDNGIRGIYPVRNPDVVLPNGPGANAVLTYTAGTGGTAGVQYDGSSGGGRVVFLAFPFESISSSSLRQQYMASALQFLSQPVEMAPPSIVTHPQSAEAIETGTAVFRVAAEGVPAPSFQWLIGDREIQGANGPTLTLNDVQMGNAGLYRVRVWNTEGIITSDPASLTVHRLRSQPDFREVVIEEETGGNRTFSARLISNPGKEFLVEASSDLIAWHPLTTLAIANSPAPFMDRDWHNFARRFYRAREVPIVSFSDFGGQTHETAMLFRPPSFSGTTSSHIATGGSLPNFARVSETFPAGLARSRVLHVAWSFASGTNNPWLRLTTFNAPVMPNPTVDFGQGLRFNVYADRSIFLTLGLRETNTTSALGEDGGTANDIEFVGGSTNNNVTPPLGRLIPGGVWTTVHFFIPHEPVRAMTGNGILQTTTGKGVLESLVIVPADGTGVYNLYLDELHAVELAP
jgi:hypothetical protein